jgi:dipeptidyl aminopeptidase/acylaminoacyl peptidase
MTNKYNSALIERELFFGNPVITGAKLSPDGKYMSFIKAYKGILNIWIKDIDRPFEEAFPLTKDEKRPIRSYFWTWDSRYILYMQDLGGDENFALYRVDPRAANKDIVPEALNLTPCEGTRTFVMSLPKKIKNNVFVGINDRDKAWHDYYSIDLETGERTLIHENREKLSGLYFDTEGNAVMASRSLPDGGNEILQISEKGLERIFYSSLEESIVPVKFREDGKVYFVSNVGDVDLAGLYLYDPHTRELEFVESDPQNKVDIENASFSVKTDKLIATVYKGDKTRIYWKDEEFEKDYLFLKEKFPDYELAITSTDLEESVFLVYISSEKDPGRAYQYDRKTGKLSFLYEPRPELPKEHLVGMKAVSFDSVDGLQIPAYLSLPDREKLENLPAVIFVHGGPWARDYWGYNSFVQFLANRGYAILQVNFRGSTGFGKAFLNAAINQWGEKMQDDLTAGYHYLVEQKIADPKKVAIMGGSYGGYATLAGLCFTPDIYAAGVSIVGPSNLFTLLDTIPSYWESARVMFHKRMGNPETEEGREQLKRQSPFFHADRIKAPLLVAQGANDPRVKKSESDQIVIAMRDHGLPVQYINFPDEGHGFAKPENNMAFIAAMEAFLAKHLGGRYQKEVADHIQDILDKAIVDVEQLEMPDIVSREQLNADMPLTGNDISDETLNYRINLKIADKDIAFEMERRIEKGGDVLKITDAAASAMGNSSDIVSIDPKSFRATQRNIHQEGMEVRLDTNASWQLSASVNMQGNEQDIDEEVGQSFLMDGAMLEVYLSSIKLKKEQAVYLRVFNTQTMKLEYLKLLKKGEDQVDSYECDKLELYSADGTELKASYWISSYTPRVMVKKLSTVKEMNGARIEMILTKRS